MNMYFSHVFNRQNAPYVLLFECFPLVYEAHKDWCLDPRGSRSPTAHGSEVMWRCFLKKLHPTFATGVLLVYPTNIRIPCWLLREDIAPNAPETKKKGSFHEGTYGIVFSHVFPLCWVPKARSTWSWCRSHGRVFGQGCPRRGGWGGKTWWMRYVFNWYIEESLPELAIAQVTSPDTVSVEEVFLLSVEWFLKLTFWQKLWCI